MPGCINEFLRFYVFVAILDNKYLDWFINLVTVVNKYMLLHGVIFLHKIIDTDITSIVLLP